MEPAVREARAEPPAASYRPILGADLKGEMRLEAPISVASRIEGVTDFPIDRRGTSFSNRALDNQIRVGLRYDSKLELLPLLLLAEYEHDLLTGPAFGRPTIEGTGLPEDQPATQQLRKAWGRISLGPYLHVGGGFTTSHWGLGLVANDGAHAWTPGSADFSDPRGGDRVLRGLVATGPLTDLRLAGSVFFDSVQGDAVLLAGDTARQVGAALIIGRDLPISAGAYLVRRTWDEAYGGSTRATVLDFTGAMRTDLGDGLNAALEGELAYIGGDTSFSASADLPLRRIHQVGLALRARLEGETLGSVVDFLYASGDANLDDRSEDAFKPNPNYAMGLILYRQVLAAHSARSVHSASDPNLVGRPASALPRFPTRGSPAGSHAFFPRAIWRPGAGFELYGGPLFAFSTAALIDPLNTTVAGGAPRNGLDGSPGAYLGTELDSGLRYRTLIAGTELTLGIEGGVLFPGSAFRTAGGDTMGRVAGARALMSYRL